MKDSPPAFLAGTYEYEGEGGSATVHVPRDRSAREIAELLAPLARGKAKEDEDEQRKRISEAA